MPRTTHTAKARAATVLADGGTQGAAGRAADRARTTVQYWLKTDPSFSAGIGRAKDAILRQAAELATLSHAEMLSRLQDEGQRKGLELRDLNPTRGTAADKLAQAAPDVILSGIAAEYPANLSRHALLDRIAPEPDPAGAVACRVRCG